MFEILYFFSLFDSFILLFFSTTDHKRRVQQWSYKQNCLLLSYSTHLKIDVHCSSKVKKKKKFYYTSLSSLVKKTFPIFFLSLSPASLLSSFVLNFLFSLACRSAPSSPIYSTNPAHRPTPSPIAQSSISLLIQAPLPT